MVALVDGQKCRATRRPGGVNRPALPGERGRESPLAQVLNLYVGRICIEDIANLQHNSEAVQCYWSEPSHGRRTSTSRPRARHIAG
jgi:hypothetical protein